MPPGIPGSLTHSCSVLGHKWCSRFSKIQAKVIWLISRMVTSELFFSAPRVQAGVSLILRCSLHTLQPGYGRMGAEPAAVTNTLLILQPSHLTRNTTVTQVEDAWFQNMKIFKSLGLWETSQCTQIPFDKAAGASTLRRIPLHPENCLEAISP